MVIAVSLFTVIFLVLVALWWSVWLTFGLRTRFPWGPCGRCVAPCYTPCTWCHSGGGLIMRTNWTSPCSLVMYCLPESQCVLVTGKCWNTFARIIVGYRLIILNFYHEFLSYVKIKKESISIRDKEKVIDRKKSLCDENHEMWFLSQSVMVALF